MAAAASGQTKVWTSAPKGEIRARRGGAGRGNVRFGGVVTMSHDWNVHCWVTHADSWTVWLPDKWEILSGGSFALVSAKKKEKMADSKIDGRILLTRWKDDVQSLNFKEANTRTTKAWMPLFGQQRSPKLVATTYAAY